MSRSFCSIFFQVFMGSRLMFMSLIHFKFILVSGVRQESRFHFYSCGYSVFTTSLVEKSIFSLLSVLDPLVKYYLTRGLFLDSIFFHCSMSIFMPVPYCLNYYSFVVYLEIKKCDACSFVVLFKILIGVGVCVGVGVGV